MKHAYVLVNNQMFSVNPGTFFTTSGIYKLHKFIFATGLTSELEDRDRDREGPIVNFEQPT